MRTRMLSSVIVMVVAACGGSAKRPEPVKPIANVAKPEPVMKPVDGLVEPVQPVDPQDAREQELQNAGILGTTDCNWQNGYGGAAYGGATYGGCSAFASLTGTGDVASGGDEGNAIYGGLVGNEAGEMSGGFGLGSGDGSATGSGGGGTGWGTIGTGTYGTIGHGSGTGSGYGVGGGRGGMRGRTNGVASVKLGNAKQSSVDLDKAIIRRYIKRNIAKITYCYEKTLLDHPKLKGTVKAEFTIGTTGTVTSSAATGMDADVAACVAGVIGAIEFPKPRGGGVVTVKYPFTFRPE